MNGTNLGKLELESFFSPYFLHWCPSSYGAYVSEVQVRSSFLPILFFFTEQAEIEEQKAP